MHLRAGNEETLACFILACSYFAPDSSWNLNYLSVLIAFSSVHHPANWLSHSSFVPDFKMLLKKSSCHLPPSFLHSTFIDLMMTIRGRQGSSQSLLFTCFLYVCGFVSSCHQQHVCFEKQLELWKYLSILDPCLHWTLTFPLIESFDGGWLIQ